MNVVMKSIKDNHGALEKMPVLSLEIQLVECAVQREKYGAVISLSAVTLQRKHVLSQDANGMIKFLLMIPSVVTKITRSSIVMFLPHVQH